MKIRNGKWDRIKILNSHDSFLIVLNVINRCKSLIKTFLIYILRRFYYHLIINVPNLYKYDPLHSTISSNPLALKACSVYRSSCLFQKTLEFVQPLWNLAMASRTNMVRDDFFFFLVVHVLRLLSSIYIFSISFAIFFLALRFWVMVHHCFSAAMSTENWHTFRWMGKVPEQDAEKDQRYRGNIVLQYMHSSMSLCLSLFLHSSKPRENFPSLGLFEDDRFNKAI